ncbi:MAG TPA: PAS domain S-box protein, partial [Planctomycetes bacterium]|nr:PAS domain S-box protein [Planctomycetota bacterium]
MAETHRILYIDNTPDVARLAYEALGGEAGFSVERAGTLAEGLERLKAGRYDAVLISPASLESVTASITPKTAAAPPNEHEKRLWNTLASLLEGCQIIGRDWRYLYINEAAAKHGRRSREELLGRTMPECYPGIEKTEMFSLLKRCMEGRTTHRVENEFVFPDGSSGCFELSIEPVPEGVFILSMDITERKRAEESIRRMNRALRAVSACNQTLVRTFDEQALLDVTCRTLAETAGYRLVWAGFAEENAARSVRPAAYAGNENGYLKNLRVSWDENDGGPVGTAIRTGKPSICRDADGEPKFAAWREETSKLGYRSFAAIPLKSGERMFGALNVYSDHPDAFDDDEIRLLCELADDLAYGIASERTRRAREKTEKALMESEARYRVLFESSAEGILIADAAGKKLVYANPAMRRMLGYTEDEIRQLSVCDIHPEDALPCVLADFDAQSRGEKTT